MIKAVLNVSSLSDGEFEVAFESRGGASPRAKILPSRFEVDYQGNNH